MAKAKKSWENVPMSQSVKNKTAKAKGVSLGKDKDGYFVYTHRARSKSYKTADAIPKSIIEKVESTG